MLRVEERRNGRPPLLSKAAADRTTPEIRYDIAPSVQLIARDSFVAETAGKIEQLQATVRLMSRDLGQIAGKVADLQATAEQDQRIAIDICFRRSRIVVRVSQTDREQFNDHRAG